MICKICKTKKKVQGYNFNAEGYPALRHGTDVSLCADCWIAVMDCSEEFVK